MQPQLLIGITGRLCSGKQTLSNLIKQYARNQDPIEIKNGNELDIKILFQNVIEQMNKSNLSFDILQLNIDELSQLDKIIESIFFQIKKNTINESITRCGVIQIFQPLQNYNDVIYLNQMNNFHLIQIEAPLLLRFSIFQEKYLCFKKQVGLDLFCYIDDYLYNQNGYIGECIDSSRVLIKNMGDQKDLLIQLLINYDLVFKEIKPQWNQFFMQIAQIVKQRSNCMKRAVGTVIVRENRILATGYNGTPLGKQNCYQGGCQRCNQNTTVGLDLERCFCFHAEENAILEVGTQRSRGLSLYTTLFPCLQCSKILIAAGIDKLFYEEEYDGNAENSELHKYMKIKQISTLNYLF